MLEVAEVRAGDRVLDLGCGPGPTACSPWTGPARPGTSRSWTATSARSRLAEMNARENGLTDFRCMTTATMDGLEPGSFDLILANPPYYANSWIAQMFIEKGRTLLEARRPAVPGDQDGQPRGPGDGRGVPGLDLEERRGYHVLRGGRGVTADDGNRLTEPPAAPGRGRVLPRDLPQCRLAGSRRRPAIGQHRDLLPADAEDVSALHRLPGDEVFHFYLGDPVRMLQLWPDGTSRKLVLGTDLGAGQVPQLVVPGGVWQGSVLVDGGAWALLGATMAPGFDYAD